ncbi:MAG: hypothetical protein ABSG19_03705 [Candidatus Aminicenantales bacterium]
MKMRLGLKAVYVIFFLAVAQLVVAGQALLVNGFLSGRVAFLAIVQARIRGVRFAELAGRHQEVGLLGPENPRQTGEDEGQERRRQTCPAARRRSSSMVLSL